MGPTRSEELLMDSSTFSSDPLYSKAIGSYGPLVVCIRLSPYTVSSENADSRESALTFWSSSHERQCLS